MRRVRRKWQPSGTDVFLQLKIKLLPVCREWKDMEGEKQEEGEVRERVREGNGEREKEREREIQDYYNGYCN